MTGRIADPVAFAVVRVVARQLRDADGRSARSGRREAGVGDGSPVGRGRASMPAMRRVVIVGCSGAGKSTLARALGARLALPVVHLDVHYWRPGWVETPRDEWLPVVDRLVAADDWIIDGNFGSSLATRLARADTAIHLDFPRRTCVRGVLSRVAREHGRSRADMAPGCVERFDWKFLKWVWGFARTERPRVLERLAEFERAGGRVVTLRSRRECAELLDAMPVPRPPSSAEGDRT